RLAPRRAGGICEPRLEERGRDERRVLRADLLAQRAGRREQRDAGEALAEAADEVGGGGLCGALTRGSVVASSGTPVGTSTARRGGSVPSIGIGPRTRTGGRRRRSRARPHVRGGDVPAPLLRGRARGDGAAQRVRAAEALRGAGGGGGMDLDRHGHVARARSTLDTPGRADVRGHGCGLREAGAELLEALPARRPAVPPVAVRARVVARR